ncbi:MAG: glutaminyl-peptide cyclotransferase [Acidobacteria bacterium]|nr:glutaminyl-peptide cyclotransferase [Acidobacteriota bacterium]
MMHYLIIIFSSVVLLFLGAFNTCEPTVRGQQSGENQQAERITAPARVQNLTYEVVNVYPHDPNAFTQGLVFHEGALYESTGLNGQSSIRKVDLQTGQVLKKVDVASQFFGEGLALFNGRAYQLTWQSQQGFIYELDSFHLINTFAYTGEGWGLTHDGRSLIMTDGTNRIRFLNPVNFTVERVINVYDGSGPVNNLNELEYIKGEIYANIWLTDRIARIDPQSGRITAWINLSGLLSPEDRQRPVDVLNGIAYDEARDRLFVTGKLWPKLFEIKLKGRSRSPRR